MPAMPMPTPSSAVRIGMPAASSEPNVTTSTTSATTTPIASVGPVSSSGAVNGPPTGRPRTRRPRARRRRPRARRSSPPGRPPCRRELDVDVDHAAVRGDRLARSPGRTPRPRPAACATGPIAVRTSWIPVPSRNDSPSGAATTTRALDGASASCAWDALLDPTPAAWSPSRSATSAWAGRTRCPGWRTSSRGAAPTTPRRTRRRRAPAATRRARSSGACSFPGPDGPARVPCSLLGRRCRIPDTCRLLTMASCDA